MNEVLLNLIVFFRENRDLIYIALGIIMLFVERWFGKTEKTPASSVLDWIEMKVKGELKPQVFDFPAKKPAEEGEDNGKSV